MEDKVAEKTQLEQQKEKRILKNEESLRDCRDNIKRTNICIVRVPEGEEREQVIEKRFEEIMIENFPNLTKEIDIQVQEAQSPNRGTQTDQPRHIIIKMSKVGDE